MRERKIIQVGIVVHDMDKALKNYTEIFGAGPWDIYEFGPPEMREPMYRGKPSEWSALLALTWVGDRHVELIKPIKGPNVEKTACAQLKSFRKREIAFSPFFIS